MNTNLKKLVPILGVCLSMTQVFAADDYSSGGQDQSANMKMAVAPAVYNPGNSGPNVYINAAYTLWTARQAGLAAGTSQAGASVSQGSVYYPAWKLRSGFKVGLGAYLDHDGWDIGVMYTWFYNKNNGTNSNNPSSNTYSSQPTSFDTTAGAQFGLTTALSSSWNNWFNRIDATLGRAFYVGNYVSTRPFIGLLGAWDEQWFDVNTDTKNSSQNQKWWGIGPYTGLNTAFIFNNDKANEWSLFMDNGVALPWSNYKNTLNVTDTTTTPSTAAGSVSGSCWSTDVMLELSLGLRWETSWSDSNDWSFLLQAAWENQVYFDHNRLVSLATADTRSGNYIMQGFTLKAQVAF